MRRSWIALGVLAAVGCGGRPGRLSPPRIDPEEAALAALKAYDENQDESLSAAELTKCPALVHVLPQYDSSGDGALSSDEIAAGIRGWSEGKMGATPWPFQVKFNGRPLEGAHVELIPEPFLGDAVKPAFGDSGQGGRGALGMSLDDLPSNAPKRPLVQPGLYRVKITHPSVKIPASYNEQTTLGLEVASYSITPDGSVWDVKGGN
jgi:hypothetical protein